jgi:hypothetical protein
LILLGLLALYYLNGCGHKSDNYVQAQEYDFDKLDGKTIHYVEYVSSKPDRGCYIKIKLTDGRIIQIKPGKYSLKVQETK